MIVVTNNEGTSGVPETARCLGEGKARLTPSRPEFVWSRATKTSAPSAAAAGLICWARSNSTRR